MEKDAIEEKLLDHEKRLDKHDAKIDILEKNDAINTTNVKNLYVSIDRLTNTLRWATGFFISGILTGVVTMAVFFIEKLAK